MDFYNTHILTVVLFTPLVGSLVLLFVPRDSATAHRVIGNLFGFLGLIVSLPLIWRFSLDPSAPRYQFPETHDWIPSIGAHYALGIDGISLLLVILTTLLGAISILSSWSAIKMRTKEYYILFLLLQVGMLGVFMSLDFFLFYMFWEVMLVPMYFLIGVWGSDRRLYAAIKFFLYTLVGSVIMLLGILALYFKAGGNTFDMPTLLASASQFDTHTQVLLFWAFFFAFAIKVPLFPFHTWLPDAHTEAPTAGSVILAGVLLKMGTYGMLRFCLPMFPEASRRFAPYIAVLAIIGIVYGALVAMVQVDLKRLVAYSSVSHLGFVVLGIFAFHEISIQGAVYQMLNHGISTGALFLCVGMLYDRRHTHLISEFGGLATPMPVLAALYLFSCFASAGLPMLNNFVGEFLILAGTFQKHADWAAWAALGVIFSAVYLLWSYQRVFFGSITQDKNGKLPDLDMRERGILFVMAALILWMGIGSPFFTRRTEAYTQNVLQLMQRPQAYNAGGARTHGASSMDLDHAPVTAPGLNTAAYGGVADSVNLK